MDEAPIHEARIFQVLTGKAQPFGERSGRVGARSAIAKQPVARAQAIVGQGLAGDEQGDPTVHGGVDKAVHCYARLHYAAWRDELPGQTLLDAPGAFGENLAIDGLDEQQVCVGDRWRAGTALLELSQGRQPCWKLNERFGVADMAIRVQQSLRAGWYMRVVEAGEVAPGDAFRLEARPHPQWHVARLARLIRDRDCDAAQLEEVLQLPLGASWLKLFARRRDSGQAEDWAARLRG